MKTKIRNRYSVDADVAALVALFLVSVVACISVWLYFGEAQAERPAPANCSGCEVEMKNSNMSTSSRTLVKADPKSLPETENNLQKDKTLSPYFFVQSESDEVDALPLKMTRADIDISGVIASVKVTQLYKNVGRQTLEAIYIFPASTKAAVHAMKMTIGERVIEAQIKEREQARADYEQAKADGRTASLLEQQRPNVFQMNVANILPGDEIKVELLYTELLAPEDGIYEFVYPTVVGPRYSNQSESSADDRQAWVKNPYLHKGENAPFTFGLHATLHGGIPVSEIVSRSHDIWVDYPDEKSVEIELDEKAENGNRDFVLDYRLQGKQIQSGVLLYPGEEENFFLMMMEPPKRVKETEITPREYVFIVDVSGSMNGFPLEISKKLMRDLLSNLRSNDFFNVLLFAGGNSVLSPKPLVANKSNIQKAIRLIDHQHGGGGTELLPALKRALSLPKAEGVSRTVVIATDGYIAVEKEAFELISSSLSDANLFPFGIGSSVNRFLIEGMARAGLGEPFVILDPQEAEKTADRFREYIQSPVLTDIEVSFHGADVYDVEPVALPDLFAKRPLILFGKYKGDATGEIEVTGLTPRARFTKTMNMQSADQSSNNRALKYLWARHKISRLSDMQKLTGDNSRIQEVTDLGLKYSLLTDYTSFVAIDSEIRGSGESTTVKQPLPLPQGVSNMAVGTLGALAQSRASSYGSGGLSIRGYGRGGGGMAKSKSAPCLDKVMAEEEAEPLLEATKTEKKASAPTSYVRLGTLVIVDAISKDQQNIIQHALKKLLPKMKSLYMKKRASNPSLSGEIRLSLQIDQNGHVVSVSIEKSSLLLPSLEREITEMLSYLKLSNFKTKKTVRVRASLTFIHR